MWLEHTRAACPETGAGLQTYLQFMSTAAYIYNLRWEEAYLDVQNWKVPVSPVGDELNTELVSIMNFCKKSPVVGGLLSIVPGLGHMYAGRFPDGIRSLLLNAAFTSLAIFSFQEDMAVLGGVFSVVEGVLYISNVYGGVNAVQQENARRILESRDRMLKKIPIPPLDVITLRKEIGL
jgi:TM2 domain-containing membrane protein YozV